MIFFLLNSEIINLRDDALTNSLCEKENLWLNSLITFIWSHFDHNIDVIYFMCLNIIILNNRYAYIINAFRWSEIQVFKAIN